MMALLLCGDIEPGGAGTFSHPVSRARRVVLACDRDVPLRVGDVTTKTAIRYAEAFERFEVFLGARSLGAVEVLRDQGLGELVRLAASYLSEAFSANELTASAAGIFISSFKHLLHLAELQGVFLNVDSKQALKPLWKLHKHWENLVPPEFRNAVDVKSALAIFCVAWASNYKRCGFLFLVSFHCLLRPDEARNLRFCDFIPIDQSLRNRYPTSFGIVRIIKPKTRRLGTHAQVQHVLIEDEAIARFCFAILDTVAPESREMSVWPNTPAVYSHRFNLCAKALVASPPWTVAGLRGGGATDHYLAHLDVPALRRRGRWHQISTVDRYIQEAVAFFDSKITEADRSRIESFAELAVAIILNAEMDETHPIMSSHY
jgi:hypothetical protein